MSQGPNPEVVKQYSETSPEHEQNQGEGGLTPSSAVNTSMETGAGEGATGFDSPAEGSQWLSNPEVGGPATPIYPPDGPADGTSKPGDDTIAS